MREKPVLVCWCQTSSHNGVPLLTSDTNTDSLLEWKTVLFNCDCHTFDEVERQLIKAIGCSLSAARRFSWQVHTEGSAVVFAGPRERCEAVAAVLEHVGLKVKVTR